MQCILTKRVRKIFDPTRFEPATQDPYVTTFNVWISLKMCESKVMIVNNFMAILGEVESTSRYIVHVDLT